MNIKRIFHDFLDTISYRDLSSKSVKQDTILKSSTCLLFSLIAFILTILNIQSHFSVMTISTAVLTVIMIVSAILYYFKKRIFPTVLIAITGSAIFSYYAITGANEGFAILWIIMIPMICMLWMGIKIGFIVSLYFQVLLIVIFYTGIREKMSIHYTDIFMTRFPILYLGTFIISSWIIYQTLRSKKQSDRIGRTDVLTKIDNRLGYNLKISTIFQNGPINSLSVFVFDVNRLKYINDEFGHEAGDEIIITGAEILRKLFPEHSVFARMGGDEFCLIIEDKLPDLDSRLADLSKQTANWKGKIAPFLSLSVGYAFGENVSREDFTGLMAEADRNMYEAKNNYYRENSIDRRRR